ncbi:MAG: glutamate ABC transporter substrate-binding protein, partial [Actinomycetota bacterium]|nr:glutamate ABC transporter substrate-binding protein [Actinomycetota bacterium]
MQLSKRRVSKGSAGLGRAGLGSVRVGRALVAAAASALVLSACGQGTGGGSEVEVVENPDFPQGSKMAEYAEAGEITIGVKYDQPGIGFQEPGAEEPIGFDIEMGKYVAGQLGIAPENITWQETVSDNREPFLQNGRVDIVLASYSITDERRALVGQAGPYYVTGQQLLVREEDKDKITSPEDLKGIRVCSVTGSTSLENVVTEYDADPVPFDTYSACVRQLQNNTVDAVTTDGAILLGYAAQDPDNLEVVAEPFSEERYGIGYFPPDDTDMCQFLNDTIQQSYQDGYWQAAFERTLGQSGVETPEPPEVDPCP